MAKLADRHREEHFVTRGEIGLARERKERALARGISPRADGAARREDEAHHRAGRDDPADVRAERAEPTSRFPRGDLAFAREVRPEAGRDVMEIVQHDRDAMLPRVRNAEL